MQQIKSSSINTLNKAYLIRMQTHKDVFTFHVVADFSREDLAAAVVNLSLNDTVMMIHKTALQGDVKKVGLQFVL